MAEFQKESGYTQLSNTLLHHILNSNCPLSKLDISVVLTIVRFTYGYQRTESGMSLKFIAAYLNAEKSHISESLKFLISSNVIKVVEPEKGIRPRVLSVNINFDKWVFTKKEKPQKNQHSTSPCITPSGTLGFPSSELPVFPSSERLGFQEKEPINKTNKENYKKRAAEEEGINIPRTCSHSSPSPASSSGNSIAPSKMNFSFNSSELSEIIIRFYSICFSYNPNRFEIEAIKKEIFSDKRFVPDEIYPIIKESFQKVATYPKDKRNTQYLLGVIRSMKKELFLKMEKQKAEEAKRIASEYLKKSQSEYTPGTFMQYYYDDMEYARKMKARES